MTLFWNTRSVFFPKKCLQSMSLLHLAFTTHPAYRAINNVTLRGIVETFDSVTLVEGCRGGKRVQTRAFGVNSQAVSSSEPSAPSPDAG